MKKLIITYILLLLFPITCFATLKLPAYPLVVQEAFKHINKPYVYATEGPNTFDCTGFTQYCYLTTYNILLNRSAKDQGYDEQYEKIEDISNLIPGDLIYFNTLRDNDLTDHAGIYRGNGEFIHCSSGKGKVIISTLLKGYYHNNFSWGRRVIKRRVPNEYNDKARTTR